jgi:SulP family sulfate permease
MRPMPPAAPLLRLLPFLAWLPRLRGSWRADLIAGITVALVLVPQSMAYAQLAGMPAYYGLYAAFLPVIVAALWGSSAQLATGPVAVVSLLTASALAPIAALGSDRYIAAAILLALMVGIVQLALGLFRLGVVVNFLSHPVIAGFTNAAAIIIGLSQFNKLLGVSMGRSGNFAADIWGVLHQIGETHAPTLAMGLSAYALMWLLRRYWPRLPGVLIAVTLTTAASWLTGFEHNGTASADAIDDVEVRQLIDAHVATAVHIDTLNRRIAAVGGELAAQTPGTQHALALNYSLELLRLEVRDAESENRSRHRAVRKFIFERTTDAEGTPGRLYLVGALPAGQRGDGHRWRIRSIGGDGRLGLVGGGEVVGRVPSGLPEFALPRLDAGLFGALLSSALVIALVGFMEAISIAKAMAAKSRERIDPNQELIGQGLANIVGSLSQSFPVSGSFSRTAVNFNAGARSGAAAVITGVIVLLTLLFLTPLLYHLPQSVLAAVIMMAVSSLINFRALIHAWKASRHDGLAAWATFIATLAFAPHLDTGILVGAGLAILLYLYRTMTPRVAILGRHPDGSLRDAKVHDLPASAVVTAVRFDGRLYFANVSFFEDAILEAAAANPRAPYLLVVGNGINELDASGEEVVHHLVERLRANGVTVVFSGLKKQVIDVMRATGLFDFIGAANLYATAEMALEAIYAAVGEAAAHDALRRGGG